MTETKDITLVQADINRQLQDPRIAGQLLETTFKGLNPENMKKAIMEGVIRGFDFRDFLEKNVYAIPFKSGYSLVTSIDHARKRGMKSGIVGVDAPVYTMNGDKIESCAVTVKRKVGEYVGDYTALVYFDEYYKPGSNGYPSLWDTKPRTMIAKVAEMHALRKACPEELSQMYTEEEYREEKPETKAFNVEPHYERLGQATTLADLMATWASMPIQAKQDPRCIALKDELKAKFAPPGDSEKCKAGKHHTDHVDAQGNCSECDKENKA